MPFRGFIAAEVGQQLADEPLGRLREALRAVDGRVSLVDPGILHLTLRFLGETADGAVGPLSEAMAKAVHGVGPVTMTFRGVGAFPPKGPPKVVWLGVEGGEPLVTIAERLEPDVRALGFGRELPFRPHLTVARVRFTRDRQAITRVVADFAGEEFGTARVARIVLMRSELRPSGPVYTPAAEVPLPA